MSEPRITYTPHPDASPESEAAALAAVYKFLLDRRARQEVASQDPQSQTRKEGSDKSLKK